MSGFYHIYFKEKGKKKTYQEDHVKVTTSVAAAFNEASN